MSTPPKKWTILVDFYIVHKFTYQPPPKKKTKYRRGDLLWSRSRADPGLGCLEGGIHWEVHGTVVVKKKTCGENILWTFELFCVAKLGETSNRRIEGFHLKFHQWKMDMGEGSLCDVEVSYFQINTFVVYQKHGRNQEE